MDANENKQALLRCIEIFNHCTLEWIDTCYSTELAWQELPTANTPQGRQGDFPTYRRLQEQLLNIFPDRQLKVLRSVAENDCVVLEQEWVGTAAITAENLIAGRIARVRVASFFTLKDGLIVNQIDYCVPPIPVQL